jgi:hypothetical protein
MRDETIGNYPALDAVPAEATRDSGRSGATQDTPQLHASGQSGRSDQRRRTKRMNGEPVAVSPGSLAIGLGYFSVALGLAELAAPRLIARAIGATSDSTTCRVVRTFGVREIATGAAILAQPDRPVWLWSRVGGDLLDLSSLRAAPHAFSADRRRRAVATWAVLGIAALDVLCAAELGRDS